MSTNIHSQLNSATRGSSADGNQLTTGGPTVSDVSTLDPLENAKKLLDGPAGAALLAKIQALEPGQSIQLDRLKIACIAPRQPGTQRLAVSIPDHAPQHFTRRLS